MTTEKPPAPSTLNTTVQVVARHPFWETSVLWVYNLEEKGPVPYIPKYQGKAKPAGWGNGGGGVEPDELEKLRKIDPENPIFNTHFVSEEDRIFAACGLREFKDESGYCEIDIVTWPDPANEEREQVRLLEYIDPDTGHRIVTLWGEVRSLVKGPIYEREEIERSEWFDLQMSIAANFRDRRERPGRPYWSHIRRTAQAFARIDNYYRKIGEPRRCVGRLIHPSWRTVFRVGRRDKRFPHVGYPISPEDWYKLAEHIIDEGIEDPDNDLIYEMFSDKIDVAKAVAEREEEERQKELDRELAAEAAESAQETGGEEATSEQIEEERTTEGIPKHIVTQEDVEYLEWWEKTPTQYIIHH